MEPPTRPYLVTILDPSGPGDRWTSYACTEYDCTPGALLLAHAWEYPAGPPNGGPELVGIPWARVATFVVTRAPAAEGWR